MILVVDPDGEHYAERLRAILPSQAIEWAPTFADARDRLGHIRALVTMGIPVPGLHLDREVLGQLPRLEWVQCLLAGHDHLTEVLSERPDILLTTTRGVHAPQMAEIVLLHMLVLAKDARRRSEDQRHRRWSPSAQPLLEGRVVAVVGLGASGRRVAQVCTALGMRVYGVSRRTDGAEDVVRVFRRDELPDIAATVDFLIVTAAADSGSRHLIDASVIRAMQPTAYLINVSRGALVDEDALVEAVATGTLAGAGLDVFSREPLPADSPLWEMENVFVTPHIGGRSDRYVEQALTVVAPNVAAFVDGRLADLTNVVAR